MSTELQSPGKRSSTAQPDQANQSAVKPPVAEATGPAEVQPETASGRSAATPSSMLASAAAGPSRSFTLGSIFWLMQIAAAGAAGYWVAERKVSQQHKIDLAVTAPKQSGLVVPVTLVEVSRRAVERGIDAVGNLHGYDELTLKTKVSGRVAKVHFDFAAKVAPGDLVLELDPTDAQLAVEQAKRNLASELAKWGFEDVPGPDVDLRSLPTVIASRLKADWNKSQLERLTALKNRGSVIAEELEQARTNALVSESECANQLLLARAGAATARMKKAELDTAMQQLAETKIYVPASSTLRPDARFTITERLVTPGAWLSAGSDLYRLVVDETMKLRLAVPERYAARVRVGQRVEVVPMSQQEPTVGVVTRIGPAVDPATRTFQVEAEIPNPDGSLKSGGFAKARIVYADDAAAQTVPMSALVTFAGVHKIFVAQQNQVKEVQVTLGYQTDQWVEIVAPILAPGTQVVTSGHSKLADGSSIGVRAASEIAADGDQPLRPASSATTTAESQQTQGADVQ